MRGKVPFYVAPHPETSGSRSSPTTSATGMTGRSSRYPESCGIFCPLHSFPRSEQDDMPVNKNEATLVLYENIALPPLDGPPTNQQLRDREHTKIFLAEIQLRYPDRPPLENLVNASIDAINLHATIPPPVVRREISNQENILLMPNTAPAVQASATPVQDFLARLAARRGAYNWAGGTSQAFTNWVNGPSPLEHPLNLAA